VDTTEDDLPPVPDLSTACSCSYQHMPHDGCDGRPQNHRLEDALRAARSERDNWKASHDTAVCDYKRVYAELDAARSRIAEVEGTLFDVLRLIQARLQPGGSPPPGGAVALVAWITSETVKERDIARVESAELLRDALSERDTALAERDVSDKCRLANEAELIKADGIICELRRELAALRPTREDK
jgi:hypothetical protein